MNRTFIGIGLCLILAGSVLSVVGHYDGVLGADDPQSFLANDETRQATARITVLGTPAEAREQFVLYASELIMPASLQAPTDQGQWVRVSMDGTDAEAYLRIDAQAPTPGTLLVFTGDVQAHWPAYDAGARILATKPILLLEPVDYHEPILFKA